MCWPRHLINNRGVSILRVSLIVLHFAPWPLRDSFITQWIREKCELMNSATGLLWLFWSPKQHFNVPTGTFRPFFGIGWRICLLGQRTRASINSPPNPLTKRGLLLPEWNSQRLGLNHGQRHLEHHSQEDWARHQKLTTLHKTPEAQLWQRARSSEQGTKASPSWVPENLVKK